MLRIGILATLCLSLCSLTAVVRAEDLRQIIDREITAGWESRKLTPAAPASDAEFLRRVSLDLIGVIPTHTEAAAFLDDTAADKRDQLIERLLADPRFARHQGDLWDVILFSRNPPGYDADKREGIQTWLQKQFAENVPYDRWVRTLLKAEGNSVDDGPAMYYVQYRNQPEDMNEAVTQTFLGVQLQCARCHDHPFESWKQVDFYGMAAFLSRVQIVTVGKKDNLSKYVVAEKSSGDILFTGPAKDATPGKKGDPVRPKFLIGDPLEEPPLPEGFKEVKFEENKEPPRPMFSRKDQLADWITRPENPYFARAVANRVWAQFMGRGLVHPVDNLSDANEASHPELLKLLAANLVEQQFDLKRFIRELVSSKTYQLSSRGAADAAMPEGHEYSRHRPLSAEELADSWRTATWWNESEQAKSKDNSNRFHPMGREYMLRYFGSPNTGAGDFQGGLQEQLYLNNGLGSVLSDSKGTLLNWLKSAEDPPEARVERMFLSLLTRRPAAEETAKVLEFLDLEKKKKDARWQDVVWSLMTSGEFRFNH